MNSDIKRFAAAVIIMAGACTLEAGSATWNLNPTSNDWKTAENWTPQTIPNSETDIATFGVSNTSEVLLEATDFAGIETKVSSIVFTSDASAYTIIATPSSSTNYSAFIAFYGPGIINNSGVVQNLVAEAATGESARIYFEDSSSAGENTVITNEGGAAATGDAIYGAFTSFEGSSSAGTATIINEGGRVAGTYYGGFTNLGDYSGSDAATFINNPGAVSGAAAAHTLIQTFLPGGNLGTSTFIANPATVPGAEGGWVEMDVGTCAGTSFIANGATVVDCQPGQIYVYGAEYGTGLGVATFTGNGGNGANAQGGLIDVFNLPLSDQTIVIAKAGTNGGLGGTILIEGTPARELDLPQFQVFGNGVLDLTNVTDPTMPIGSLAGNGMVLLAGHNLSIGNNNLSTTFSGVIQESGALTKVGTGTLTLTGANTYIGATTVSAGTLIVSNRSGSATGTGSVNVSAGTLGGKGIIQGAVTLGTGNGAGAFLAPSIGSNQPARLTLKKTLTFKADSNYTYKLNTNNARADQVIAKGVTIVALKRLTQPFDFEAGAKQREQTAHERHCLHCD